MPSVPAARNAQNAGGMDVDLHELQPAEAVPGLADRSGMTRRAGKPPVAAVKRPPAGNSAAFFHLEEKSRCTSQVLSRHEGKSGKFTRWLQDITRTGS